MGIIIDELSGKFVSTADDKIASFRWRFMFKFACHLQKVRKEIVAICNVTLNINRDVLWLHVVPFRLSQSRIRPSAPR